MRQLRIVFVFYQNFMAVSMPISLWGCFMLWEYGNKALIPMVWTKIASNVVMGGWFHFFRGQRLYFYFNLGFSLRYLYCLVFLIDLAAWIFAAGLILIL